MRRASSTGSGRTPRMSCRSVWPSRYSMPMYVRRFLVDRQSPVIDELFDAVDVRDLDGEVVVGAVRLRQCHQLPAGFLRGVAVDGVKDLALADVGVQAVRTLDQDVAAVHYHIIVIHLDGGVLADAARQHRAELAGHGLVLGDQ